MNQNKIILFTSSLMSLPLIGSLVSKNQLACVVLTARNDMDTQTLVQWLTHNKIVFFHFDENNEKLNIDKLNQFDTTLALVFNFPYKLSKDFLSHFSNNIFNIHASHLPKYKGNQPVFWQLRNGEMKTALSLCYIEDELDSGEIILQHEFDIQEKDTYGTLNSVLSQGAVPLVDEFFTLIEKDILSLPAIAQIGEQSFAPKVEQKDIMITWGTMKSKEIVNLVRASNPIFGGAQTMWRNSSISFLEVTAVNLPNMGLEAGTILHIGSPEGLIVVTIDGTLRIDIVSVPEGLFSGLRFAKRFNLDAGEKLATIKF
jgi:methionyl-tRNA formyltransferase